MHRTLCALLFSAMSLTTNTFFYRFALLLSLMLWLTGCCTSTYSSINAMPTIASAAKAEVALHVIGVYRGSVPALTPSADCDAKASANMVTGGGAQPCAAGAPMSVQSASGQGGVNRPTVHVYVRDDSQPLILGLMAYEAVHWQVHVASGVIIQKVILAGYKQQQLSGLEGTLVDVYTYENSPCMNCVQKGRFFYAHDRVPYEMEAAAGVRARSFQGNETGGEYHIFKAMP